MSNHKCCGNYVGSFGKVRSGGCKQSLLCCVTGAAAMATEDVMVIIGDEDCSREEQGTYCNGPLHSGRKYRYIATLCRDSSLYSGASTRSHSMYV